MMLLRFIGWLLVAFGSYWIVLSFAQGNWGTFIFTFVFTFFILILVAGKHERETYGISAHEVEILKAWQDNKNERTVYCKGNSGEHEAFVALIPTRLGWMCPECRYRQPYSIAEESLIRFGFPDEKMEEDTNG